MWLVLCIVAVGVCWPCWVVLVAVLIRRLALRKTRRLVVGFAVSAAGFVRLLAFRMIRLSVVGNPVLGACGCGGCCGGCVGVRDVVCGVGLGTRVPTSPRELDAHAAVGPGFDSTSPAASSNRASHPAGRCGRLDKN